MEDFEMFDDEENQKKYIIIHGQEKIKSDSDDITKYIQPMLTANINLNVLLGSGASIPSIPIMGQTFEEYKEDLVGTPYEENLNNLVAKYVETPIGKEDKSIKNIELFLSWLSSRIEGMSESELSNHEVMIKKNLIEKLLKSVHKGFYEEINSKETNEKKQSLPLYKKFISRLVSARQHVDDSHDVINIFTPNYDLYIEKALDDIGYPYTDGFKSGLESMFSISEYGRRVVDTTKRYRDKWSPVSPFFRVYKLHGSLNWERGENGSVKKIFDQENESNDLLIAPTSSKYADTQGYPFSDLFRELSVELLKPNSVMVISGYGFGDEHINNFLNQALGRPDFTLIAFIEPTAQQTEYVKSVNGSLGAIFITNANNSSHEDSNEKSTDSSDSVAVRDAHFFSKLSDFLDFGRALEGEE